MIADLYQDVLPFLGKADSVSDEELGALAIIHPGVERAVKDFTGTEIEQANYTHYLPMRRSGGQAAAAHTWWEKQGDKAVEMSSAPSMAADRLILPEVPVTSISSVYEDYDAYAGQRSGDFPSSALLTSGTDYWLPGYASGLCRNGLLMRRGTVWSSRPGTVKVTYTAGWTANQLRLTSSPGIAGAIKMAVLVAVRREFSAFGEGGIAVKSERMGDYAVQYAVEAVPGKLPRECRKLLMPFIHYGRKL